MDAGPRSRVLVVEDETDLRRLLRVVLSEGGFEVMEAANGADALVLAQRWRPDVILLDMMMPVMNGWPFAERYAESTEDAAAVVVLTAAGPGATRSASNLCAVSAVLSKPIDVDALLEVVGYHVSERTSARKAS